MDTKAVFLSVIIAFAAAPSTLAQGAPPSSITVPPGRPLVRPGLGSGSELERYNDTYLGLHSFWSDDVISSFFKHVADGTLNQVIPSWPSYAKNGDSVIRVCRSPASSPCHLASSSI